MSLYYDDRAAWNRLAQNDMQLDVSWTIPAQSYMEMFKKSNWIIVKYRMKIMVNC